MFIRVVNEYVGGCVGGVGWWVGRSVGREQVAV